ncbi:MAG: hypothetical protein LBT09_10645 [Planctomycetaceae bacterium]|jgi:hypothetical protein|nr:hypothetical protein [Planctomycetaceae bacterium]
MLKKTKAEIKKQIELWFDNNHKRRDKNDEEFINVLSEDIANEVVTCGGSIAERTGYGKYSQYVSGLFMYMTKWHCLKSCNPYEKQILELWDDKMDGEKHIIRTVKKQRTESGMRYYGEIIIKDWRDAYGSFSTVKYKTPFYENEKDARTEMIVNGLEWLRNNVYRLFEPHELREVKSQYMEYGAD